MLDGWDYYNACLCFEPVSNGGNELYECCFAPAGYACGMVSGVSHYLFVYCCIGIVFAMAYGFSWLYSDWSIICSIFFQLVILCSRTYYWGHFGGNSYTNWEEVVFWKAGTSLSPIVHLA